MTDASDGAARRDALKQAAAAKISEALRVADVANHRELADTIAPGVVEAVIGEIRDAKPPRANLLRRAFRPKPQQAAPAPETTKPKLTRLLALDRERHAVIASWRADGVSFEPVSTLTAAIKSFLARESIDADGAASAMHSYVMNFHGARVLLRASAKTILAGQFPTEPSPQDRLRLDRDFMTLLKNDKNPVDSDLQRVAATLAAPEPKILSRKRMFGAGVAGLAGLAVLIALGSLILGDGTDARLRRLEEGFSRAADADALQALAERLHETEKDVATLTVRMARAEQWQSERKAETEGPLAQLATLAQHTIILFGDEDDFLDPVVAQRQLVDLATKLKETDARLRIVGYSDAKGSTPKNLALSRARAKAVNDVLQEQGIAANRLVDVGRGDQAPIAAEDSRDRRRNRRVTFEVLVANETAR